MIWLNVKKVHPEAKVPEKKMQAAGLDLTLVALVEDQPYDPDIEVYDTGLQISCTHGFYFDLIERSSLWKQGYTLANNVGVIDPDYRGNLLVVLRKVREGAKLTLPFRGVQLVARQVFPVNVVEVDSLEETERGSGGFGSTGN